MKKNKLIHKNAAGRLELRCPACREQLEASDLENFTCCPYCGKIFAQTDALEDFILDPLIRRWIRQNPLSR